MRVHPFGRILAAIVTLALAACSAKDERKTIVVAAFPDLDRAVKAALPAWKRAHPDIDVKVVSREYGDHHTAMTTALATGSGLPDVMAIDRDYIGKFAASGGFENLAGAPYDAAAHKGKFVSFAIAQASGPSGNLVAIPTDIGPGTLLYRKDIVEQAGLTEADLTKSWESYIASGKRIKEKTGAYLLAHAADIRDIYLRSGLSDGEGMYFRGDGTILVESQRFVRAFELGLAARRAGIDAKTPHWTNEWSEGLKRGRIATQMMGAWLVGHLKNGLAPQTSGMWRSANLPSGTYGSYGGSFYAIPAKAGNKAAAWEFVKLMTMEREIQLGSMRAVDAFPALREAQNDPYFEQPIEFLGGQVARVLWREIAEKIPAVPVNRNDTLAAAIVNAEFDKVLNENKGIGAALADAKQLIEQRIRR
ncbi:ABC transporter substrate-binding protein [Usitatibacter palustris]|uniref:Lactose-binding protein n=1 Tax=Usitatibacter palustris TaxID=2732487 RepID=A0A6M4H454_9PROT|nr:extracellular solute-binding protein [Usitatibacter palustris]QJR14062.1 Lactose-binding protein [Usitatibacter palustris]